MKRLNRGDTEKGGTGRLKRGQVVAGAGTREGAVTLLNSKTEKMIVITEIMTL